MADTDPLVEISEKLDAILGFIAVRGMESPDEMIARLRGLGLNTKVIAHVTGLTENAVSIRVTRMKKPKKKKSKSANTA